jgi:hypothetical protein
MITLEEIVSNPPAYLGTVDYFSNIFKLFSSTDEDWTISQLKSYLSTSSYAGYPYINRGIEVGVYIGVLEIRDEKIYLDTTVDLSSKSLESVLIEGLLNRLRMDGKFTDVFPDGSIYFDVGTESFLLNPSLRPAKYAPVWNMISDIINPNVINVVSRPIEIEKAGYIDCFRSGTAERFELSLSQLKERLAAQELAGREAELFTLEYERNRLDRHDKVSKVAMISDFNVGAGYDIISFDSVHSDNLDRYIEVKSCSDSSLQFYWSENEIETARLKKDNYYLYLVERQKMKNPGYVPYVIQNPYHEINESGLWSQYPSVVKVRKNRV